MKQIVGEIVVVPEKWNHEVENVGRTIGIQILRKHDENGMSKNLDFWENYFRECPECLQYGNDEFYRERRKNPRQNYSKI